MKSPFPGMDPYLEARWSDVHPTLIALIKEALQPSLPRPLRARSEERLLVEDLESDERLSYRADVAVVQVHPSTDDPNPAGATATIEPIAIAVEAPELFDRFIHIIDTTAGNRVVTAIEVLSPWNKLPGRLNEKYRQKIADYQSAGVNIVEIDLLRSTRDYLPIPHSAIPKTRRAPYLTCVFFARTPHRWYAYPHPFREPLGTIPIPLRPQDPVLGLELQPLIHRAYTAGGHDDIDYTSPPEPPLTGDDGAWAQNITTQAPRP